MTLLAGFIDVLLRGLGLIALSAAFGGAAFALLVLRPLRPRDRAIDLALGRALALIGAGAWILAASRAAILLVVHPWALADEDGRWPVAAFLATDFGRAGLAGIALAAALALAAARARSTGRGWAPVAGLAVATLVAAAWLSHAVSRLEGRGPLMLATGLHQAGAAVWVGGLLHMVGFAALWRRTPGAAPVGVAVLARFSALAIGALAMVLGPGLALSWSYVGDAGGLIGTGYGVMVLTKTALLAGALALGALNFALARRWARGA